MKEKIYKILYNNRLKLILLGAFLIPAVLLAVVYAKLGFYPFGNKSVLIMDMADQYVEFFASLRYMFDGDNTMLFSWSRSMGGNYMGLAAYYVASPLSFITLFFSLENLPVGIMILTILKIGLSGLTFATYLEYGWNKSGGKVKTIVFASCYALMSYAIVYSMCPMWLDALVLLPLILLGVEKLIDGKKGLLFFVSLACLFISNYYTAYMAGIFTAMYLLYRTLTAFSKEQWKKVAIIYAKFTGNTLMAFGISAPLILSTLKDLAAGKLSTEQYVPTEDYNFQLWSFIERLFGGEYSSITNSGLPAVFCGTIVLVLVILFFFMRKINWKEKLGAAIILLFMIASFWIVNLDLAWHGFRYPNWFPYRYAFVFSTFMVIIAHRAAMEFELDELTKKKLPKTVLAYLAIILILFQYMELYNNTYQNITGLDNQFKFKKMADYQDFVNKYEDIVTGIEEKDDGFYRMEKDAEFSKNDAMLLGYNGMTHYSSTFHAGVNSFTGALGIAQAHIWNSGYGSSVMTDSIFNVKYRMMKAAMPETYKAVETKDDVTVYENTKVLPIAFASGKIDTIEFSGDNNFDNQNRLFNQLAQTDNVEYFKPLEYVKALKDLTWTYSLEAKNSNPVYLRMFGNIGWGTVNVNDSYVGNHFSSETNCNLFLGQFESGQEVKIGCSSDNVICTGELIYEMDLEAFDMAYNKLAEGALEITKQKGTTIEGKIKVGEDQMIFTSIPYEDGYTVKVDGKEVEKGVLKMQMNGKENDVFLTIPADEGEHTISITYCPAGFIPGVILAVIALLVAVIYYKSETIKNMLKGNKKVQEQTGV